MKNKNKINNGLNNQIKLVNFWKENKKLSKIEDKLILKLKNYS